MRDVQKVVRLIAAASLFIFPANLDAQVTTATLLGEVRDTSGAAVPGATIVARHQGTGVPRDAISNERGEFVLTALPTGLYSVTISLTGFKTYTNEGIVLGAGQTVRQAFTLEVGTVEESVLVSGEAPIIETAASLQAETLGSQEVRELPVNRRNLTNLLGVAPGVSTSGGGDVQMNGVAGGGTGITVDGTEANSNPEERSMSHYGGQNQISVMSLDSIAEVQVVRGVLPAEYGGVAGGQVNVISRSGTNALSGSAFYNFQSPTLNARSFFSTTPKGTGSFNQYGGTLGGPVLRNKLFFFTTYEGYREEVELNLTGNVPESKHKKRAPCGAAVSGDEDCARYAAGADRANRLGGRRRRCRARQVSRAGHSQANRESRRRQRRLFGLQWREPRDDLHPDEAVDPRPQVQRERLERSRVSQRTGSNRVAFCDGARAVGVRKPVRLEPNRSAAARRVLQRHGSRPTRAGGNRKFRSPCRVDQHQRLVQHAEL